MWTYGLVVSFVCAFVSGFLFGTMAGRNAQRKACEYCRVEWQTLKELDDESEV